MIVCTEKCHFVQNRSNNDLAVNNMSLSLITERGMHASSSPVAYFKSWAISVAVVFFEWACRKILEENRSVMIPVDAVLYTAYRAVLTTRPAYG